MPEIARNGVVVFPAPFGPRRAIYLAASDVEIEVAEHRGTVVAGRQALDGEHRLVLHRPPAGWGGAAGSA